MNSVLNYLWEMIPILLCVLPVAAVWRFWNLRRLRRLGLVSTPWHEAGVVSLVGFFVYIAVQTVVPRVFRFPGMDTVNLIPLRVLFVTWDQVVRAGNFHALWINFVGNIAIFMPVGFLTALCFRAPSARRSAMAGFGCSLCAEVGQLFSERCSDVDDLWLNTLGALVGYGVYLLVAKLFPGASNAFRVREKDA